MKHKAVIKRGPLRYYLPEMVMAYLVVLASLLFIVAAATDDYRKPAPAPTSEWVEPYGGCDEAYLYPESQGYAECKEHGLIP